MADRGKIQIYACRSAQDYADQVINELHNLNDDTKQYENLKGILDVKSFANGEIEVDIGESVRKKDVYLFQNCAQRNKGDLSVGENKHELYQAIDALKRAQANTLTIFEPYCTSARSDRATRRTSVGIWVHFKIMIQLGMDHYITLQLHSDKSKTIMDPTSAYIDDMPAASLMKKYLLRNFVKTKQEFDTNVRENWAFCTVDVGGEKLAYQFAETFNCGLIVANKRRNVSKVNFVESIDILSNEPIQGKTIWVVDDMIDTGGSVVKLLDELKQKGVKEINVAVIHPELSGSAVDKLQKLMEDSILNNLVCLDTIFISDEIKKRLPRLHVIPSAHFAADLIYRINVGYSITKFFSPIRPYDYLN